MEEIRISEHFIERFNLRYFGRDESWRIRELKGYMGKIFKPHQLKYLIERKDFNDPQYINFGNKHMLVVRNNTMITLYNKNI